MNNADLQALVNKRETNIQKLKNHLDAGKTVEEKIVANLIKNIKKAEETLSGEGYTLESLINDDGTFSPATHTESIEANKDSNKSVDGDDSSDESAVISTAEPIAKAKTTKKATAPSKKLRDSSPEKPEITKIGVTVKESIKNKIDVLADDNSMKPNEVVVDLLGKVFDGKEFTVAFDKKENTKVTSFNIPNAMDKALIKLNKKTGIPKSELFNKLIEEVLKEFFE